MNKKVILMAASLCLSVPSMAFAESGKVCPTQDKKAHNKHHNIEKMDLNKDAKVSFSEFKKSHSDHLKKKFERMDANGDGFISKEDKQARHEKRASKFFDGADSNHDGILSKQEFIKAKKQYKHTKH
ncbi:MAG: EF-hand domain-containing protein [Mariprofundaceae bacterium]